MKTLAKFLFSLSLLAGITACDDDAPTTGEIVLDIEKYMYVQSISIYTELGNKIYENREYLYEGGRLSIPLNPAEFRLTDIPTAPSRFRRGTRRGSTTTSTGTEASPTTDERPAHPQPRRGRYAIAGGAPAHLHRQTSSPHAPAPRSSAAQLLRPAKTNKFALHSA